MDLSWLFGHARVLYFVIVFLGVDGMDILVEAHTILCDGILSKRASYCGHIDL